MAPLKALSLSGRFSVMVQDLLGDLVFDRLIRHRVFPSCFCFLQFKPSFPDVLLHIGDASKAQARNP